MSDLISYRVFNWQIPTLDNFEQTTYRDKACGMFDIRAVPAPSFYDRVRNILVTCPGVTYGEDVDGAYLHSVATANNANFWLDTGRKIQSSNFEWELFYNIDTDAPATNAGPIRGGNTTVFPNAHIDVSASTYGYIITDLKRCYINSHTRGIKLMAGLKNGQIVSSLPLTAPSAVTNNSNENLWLFGSNNGVFKGKIYGFKLWEDGELVMDLVPVKPTVPADFNESYVYNTQDININSVGNTAEIVAALATQDASYVDFDLSDGVYGVELRIFAGYVTFEGQTFTLDTSVFNRYTISMQDNLVRLAINKIVVYEAPPTTTNSTLNCAVGYQNYSAGASQFYIQYAKLTKGYRRYIDLSKVSCELQVDTSDTFDSVNLRTYKNTGDDCFCLEDSNVEVTGITQNLVRSFSFPLVPRQDMQDYFYFYRVRVNDDIYYTSDYGYSDVVPEVMFRVSTNANLQKTTDVPVNTTAFVIQTNSAYQLKPNTGQTPDDFNFITYPWDSGFIWQRVSNSLFRLAPDTTSRAFKNVFHRVLPNKNVYTKAADSGNIADFIKSAAASLDKLDFEVKNTYKDFNLFTCRDAYLQTLWGTVFGLDSNYFNNLNEFRNTLLSVYDVFCNPTLVSPLGYLVKNIMGVAPEITENKDNPHWVLWDDATAITKPDSERWILKNEFYPYTDNPTIIIESDISKTAVFWVDVYNPYDIKYSDKLIEELIMMYKPVASYVIIRFYDSEGRRIDRKYYWGRDQWGKALWNK